MPQDTLCRGSMAAARHYPATAWFRWWLDLHGVAEQWRYVHCIHIEGMDTPAAGAAQTKPKGKRKKGPATTDYIERPRDTGPSPLELIHLQPGVSLKGADGAKSGPPLKSDPSNMTRAEFVAYAAKKNRASKAAAAMYPPVRAAAAASSRTGSGGQNTPAASPAVAQATVTAGAGGGGGPKASARSGVAAERRASSGTADSSRGPGVTERTVDGTLGSTTGSTAGQGRSGESGGRVGVGSKGSTGGLERGARPGAQPAKAPRERGLKGPLRRRTDDVPQWIQQGKLKPPSAGGGAGRPAGVGRGGAASQRLPPVGAPASTAGFEPPPGMPVTKPTRDSIRSTRAPFERV